MSEITVEMIQDWAKTKFAGLEKPQLRAACQRLEIEAGANTSIEGYRLKLNRHFGNESNTASADEVQRSEFRAPPNFKLLVGWAGRKYRVKVNPVDKELGSRPYYVPWEGQAFPMDPRKAYVDVPAPIFHNLQDAQGMDLKTEYDSQRKEMVREPFPFQRFTYNLIGITPGTEHLPEDARGWFIQDAKDHGLYAGYSREVLERIWSYLTDGARPNAKDVERNTDYWRRSVLEFLGLTPEQIEAQEFEQERIAA